LTDEAYNKAATGDGKQFYNRLVFWKSQLMGY